MSTDLPVPAAPVDARALQLWLYREVGLAAVAAALDLTPADFAILDVRGERATEAYARFPRQNPAILVPHDKAA